MKPKTYKAMYQTECRHPQDHPRWTEDHTTNLFTDKSLAIADALECCNKFQGWQYRVVEFVRGKVVAK